jgi:hypothetical protein
MLVCDPGELGQELDDARRAVLYAAESYVYAHRWGWLTPEHTDTLINAVDTLTAATGRYISQQHDPTGQHPAYVARQMGIADPCPELGHVEHDGRDAYLEGRPDVATGSQ